MNLPFPSETNPPGLCPEHWETDRSLGKKEKRRFSEQIRPKRKLADQQRQGMHPNLLQCHLLMHLTSPKTQPNQPSTGRGEGWKPLVLKPSLRQDEGEGQTEHQEKSTVKEKQEITPNGLTTGVTLTSAALFGCSEHNRKGQ